MNRIKELRKEKKLTQQEVADAMGVSRRGFQKWENGDSQLKPDKIKQLAKYFEVSEAYLLGYDISTELEFLPKGKQYLIRMNELTIDLIRDCNKMTAQEVSNIKRGARNLYEELVRLEYESEEEDARGGIECFLAKC